jgi:lipoprotein-anchoring transpeptidase ErfK/SrfK
MFRPINIVFAALAVCAMLPATQAAAQYRAPIDGPPGLYRDGPAAFGWYRMPSPTWFDDEPDDQRYQRRRVPQMEPRYVQGAPARMAPDEADTDLPPPGLPQFNAPASGDVVRPPAPVVGAAPPPAPGANEPPAVSVAVLPPEDQPETGEPKELAPNLKRQLVDYQTKEPAGTLLVDTQNTYLYLVLGNGKALRYGVRVGRDGFTWAGTERISKMAEWPDWHPPTEMIERQPYLPRFTAGGPGNPLGARAMYLGKTIYRIHGTNQPSTIGKFVSSGCVGMLNEDVEDLYSRVQVGTRVVVLPGAPPAATASNASAAPVNGNPPPPAANGAAPASSGAGAITSSPLPPASRR